MNLTIEMVLFKINLTLFLSFLFKLYNMNLAFQLTFEVVQLKNLILQHNYIDDLFSIILFFNVLTSSFQLGNKKTKAMTYSSTCINLLIIMLLFDIIML